MRTNTNLEEVCTAIDNMFDKQIEKEMANEEEILDKYHAPVNYGTYSDKIKTLKEAVQNQAAELAEKVGGDLPKYLYNNHEKFELPRFISMQPSKQTGLYHETIMDKAMDGATSMHILASAVPLVEQGKTVSYDFLDSQSVLNNEKKEPAKQNTLFQTVPSDLQMPMIVKEFVMKDRDSGLESVKYYKTMPTNFVENTADGTSKLQPRLHQRLGGITQREANNMYWKAEELIVSNLEQNHPEAFATLTENQQHYKTLPRYINNNTPLPVQEAMFTKELANAFIAIRTHMPEAEAKVSHVSFLNRNFNPMHPENVTEYNPAVREKVYEAALNAHNVAETTTAIVLGKRIKMAVEAEKAQAPTITKEQVKEAARKVAVKAAEAVLEAAAEKHPAAAAVNAAVKKTRTRSKAATKAKEKDQGLEL